MATDVLEREQPGDVLWIFVALGSVSFAGVKRIIDFDNRAAEGVFVDFVTQLARESQER